MKILSAAHKGSLIAILLENGFVENDKGAGYHIVYTRAKNGYPNKRLHALLVDEGLEVHHDSPLKGTHKVSRMTQKDKIVFRSLEHEISKLK